MNFTYYEKFKLDLSDECRYLFDKLYNDDDLIEKVISQEAKERLHQIPYLNDDIEYAKFRTAAEYQPNFTWAPLSKISKNLDKKYDIIYLSCIHRNAGAIAAEQKEIINLGKSLNPGGVIFANYNYGYSEKSMIRATEIADYSSIPGFEFSEHKLRIINDQEKDSSEEIEDIMESDDPVFGLLELLFRKVADTDGQFDNMYMLTKTR